NRSGGFGSTTGFNSGFGNTGIGRQGLGGTTTPSFGAATSGVGGGAQAGSSAQLNPGQGQVPTRIVPDEQTNSLLIQATPDDYREILAILNQLDRKRMRVLIEVQVFEISDTDDLFWAIEGDLLANPATNRNLTPLRGQGITSFGLLAPQQATTTLADGTTTQTLGLTPNFGQVTGFPSTLQTGGLIFALTKGGFDKVPLILQTLKTLSNANLVTRPITMTNDNEPAQFQIGESRPFSVATSTSVSAFSGFDRADATSTLQITPRVSSGNNLTLQIALQIESFGASSVPNAPPPSTSRGYQGTVTVPNRQYVVFGGLEQDEVRETRSTLPLLGDIPYIGYLFGKTDYSKTRTRIYVFVRPVIFTDDDFAGEKKSSTYLHDQIRAESLLKPEQMAPLIPDEVLDADAPGLKATVYSVFGDGGNTAFPENKDTREARKAAASVK
ncbi:MAG TPA: secretin N-terminal domain-containing protein, partial [Planctomycetota bacterium]|nr:secretin N-terminal domain-containing protein [Planctomycetota bacterium]